MQVVFDGNRVFSAAELLGYISSQPTNRSLPNKVLSTYHSQAKRNKAVPNIYVEELGKAIENFKNEYQYFRKELAEADIQVLTNLYNVNGFHLARIYYTFMPNKAGENVLTFHIEENQQSKLASPIVYNGLNDLPKDVTDRINLQIHLDTTSYFNEERIEQEMKSINNILLRQGYMHSTWDYPYVFMDTSKFLDSVIGYFNPGERITIGKIIFVDSNYDQQVVANSSKQHLIRIKEDDYYNAMRIERSIDNLLSTGVFESVTIDTMSGEYEATDHTRDFIITSKYKRLRSWEAGAFLNQTSVDNLVNTGLEGALIHRNLFGSAQLARLYANASIKDMNRVLSKWSVPDVEFKIGFSYAQPILWQIKESRTALSTSLEYSVEFLNGLFKISNATFPILFTTRLPFLNYYTNLNVEFNISRQVPMNFNSVVNTALSNASSKQDSNAILSSITLYQSIYNYLNEPNFHLFTSNLIAISLIGDDRNHPFSPTKGSWTYFSLDGINPVFFPPVISGGAKYFRLQAAHTHFTELSSQLVLGLKAKAGYIYLFDGDNTFVPQDRQLFCGGANSVRAWSARELRYSNLLNDMGNNSYDEFAKTYIGSSTLLEGSIELRRKLSDMPGLSDNVQWIFNDLELGVFVDVGNCFGWYMEDKIDGTKMKLYEYLTKLAVGAGFGIRYNTAIGPIRIDLATPLYDPMEKRHAFWDLAFVFGIGHSF
jgi:outer membrane protein assembly factor BamA